MIDQQFEEQMRRLKIFGNLKIDELAEYRNTLSSFGYTEFVRGIDWLIKNYEKHTFPLPSEIIKAIKDAAYISTEYEKTTNIPLTIKHQCGQR